MKKLVISVAVLYIALTQMSSHAMQQGDALDELAKQFKQEQQERVTPKTEPSTDEVKIVSSDGKAIIIKKNIAQKSNTIKDMLEDIGTKEIPLPNIDKSTVDVFVAVAKKENELSAKLDGLDDKERFENFKSLLPQDKEQLIQIINAANYLDYSQLLNASIYALANLAAQDKSKNAIPQEWLDKVTEKNLYADIKNAYILTKGNDFIQAAKAIFNEWQRDYPGMFKTLLIRGNLCVNSAKMVIFGNSDLIKKYIDEQKRIANDEIKNLNLANNLLEVIPSDFSQLFGTTITELNLSNNKIKEIKSEAFNGLKDLQYLYLNKNNLTELDPSLFSNLRSLSYINLADNPLKQESIDALRKALPRIRIDF